MYNVFARFDTSRSAQSACDKVLSSTNGITRIGTRMVIPPHAEDMHNPNTAEAIGTTVLHSAAIGQGENSITDGSAVAAARLEAEYDRRTGYEPPSDKDYILCAQGSREAVEHAAKLLRSLGGRCVDVRDAKGDFLSGQPPIV